VLAHRLLDTHAGSGELPFDVAVHLGTLAAVLVYFRKDVARLVTSGGRAVRGGARRLYEDEGGRLLAFVVIATVPTAAAGLLLKGWMEGLRADGADGMFWITVGLLFLNGVFLTGSDWLRDKGMTMAALPLYAALAVGVAQGVAVLPGISRSGATVVAAVAVGFSRSNAARIAFLCAIPAIAGAGLVEVITAREELGALGAVPLAVGTVASFGVGLPSIYVLVSALKRSKLKYFGIYCLVVSILGFACAR